MAEEKDYLFEVTGGWTIVGELKPQTDFSGSIFALTLSDGRVVRLVVALEVEDHNGDFKYITSEKEMKGLGFEGLDYAKTDFIEVDENITS